MKTYTQHKLTDAMLRRLSKTKNGKSPGGTSTDALERRGLVKTSRATVKSEQTRTWRTEITDAGREALAQARLEGW